jgi:hypothetical protein
MGPGEVHFVYKECKNFFASKNKIMFGDNYHISISSCSIIDFSYVFYVMVIFRIISNLVDSITMKH